MGGSWPARRWEQARCFKGQMLIGAPVLIFWPLAARRFGAAARMAVGFMLMAGALLSPWIVLNAQAPAENPRPICWFLAVILATAIDISISLFRKPILNWTANRWHDLAPFWRRFKRREELPVLDTFTPTVPIGKVVLITTLIALGLLLPPILILGSWPRDADISHGFAVLLLLALFIGPWLCRRRSLPIWYAAMAASAIWLTPWLFHGDWSWETVGYEYGTQKFDAVAMSLGTNANFPAILARRFDWELHDPAVSLRLPNLASALFTGASASRPPAWMHIMYLDGTTLTLDLKQAMLVIYVLMLLACGIAAAAHARRRDPRILAAFAAPWVLMPNVLCQMSNRYHLWGAVLAAMLIGIQGEFIFLTLLISLLGAATIGGELLKSHPERSPQIASITERLAPDIGWVSLTLALIIFVISITPAPRRRLRG